jgi:hypothetical protein
LKLLKDTIRTKFEIHWHGPTALQLQKLEDQLDELKQDNEQAQRSFFVLPHSQPTNEEDLK